MKYYVAFLKVDQKTRSNIKGLQGMNCPLDWESDDDSNLWFTLYAWTNEKKLMKKFKRQRNKSLFVYKTFNDPAIDHEHPYDFDKINESCKLREYTYLSDTRGEETLIVSTGFENTSSCDEGLLFEIFGNVESLPDPLLLSNEVLYLFERFAYSYIFYNYSVNSLPFDEEGHPNDQDVDLSCRQDVFWNNYSYMDRETWTYFNEKNMKCNAFKINEFDSFISLFGELF